jgi:hypothetical protein
MRRRAYPTPYPEGRALRAVAAADGLVRLIVQFDSRTVTYGVPAGQVQEFRRRVGVVALCLGYRGWWLTGELDDFHQAVDALAADTVPESYYLQVLASRAARDVR